MSDAIAEPLGITPPAFARPARLRADRIRCDTLTRLAAALREDHDNTLQNALDALIDAMGRDCTSAEIGELVGDIEDLADMGRADMALTDTEVRQLAEQANAAVDALPPVLRSVRDTKRGAA